MRGEDFGSQVVSARQLCAITSAPRMVSNIRDADNGRIDLRRRGKEDVAIERSRPNQLRR